MPTGLVGIWPKITGLGAAECLICILGKSNHTVYTVLKRLEHLGLICGQAHHFFCLVYQWWITALMNLPIPLSDLSQSDRLPWLDLGKNGGGAMA